jgi:hypothetical protein
MRHPGPSGWAARLRLCGTDEGVRRHMLRAYFLSAAVKLVSSITDWLTCWGDILEPGVRAMESRAIINGLGLAGVKAQEQNGSL